MSTQIKLPKLKENVDSVEVSEVLVKAGQVVEKDQALIVVNADKSNMEVYAPAAGKILELKVKPGDELKIGAVYCVMEGGNGEGPSVPPAQERINEHAEEPTVQEVRAVRAGVTAIPALSVNEPRLAEPPAGIVPASPATRWLARKLGVELKGLSGSGPRGRITEDDVRAAFSNDSAPAPAAGGGIAVPPMPNFEEFGPVKREAVSRVRKLIAQKMSLSWQLVPHVTQHDVADITELEAFRKQQEARGVKLTVTAFVLKACVAALKQFPGFNCSYDVAKGQLVYKQYYHLGVAVDTKGGLLVPVLRDVDKKGVVELARELNDTAEKARAGKADMSGGTFTITNLGGIGGTSFTPIINYPEVAILGLSRSKLQPAVKDGQVVPRLQLPLSLSYDHRVIDGADAARFTRRIAEMLETPWLIML